MIRRRLRLRDVCARPGLAAWRTYQAELGLVARLFDLRKKVGGDGAKRAQLDQASSQLAQLRPAEARKILDTF